MSDETPNFKDKLEIESVKDEKLIVYLNGEQIKTTLGDWITFKRTFELALLTSSDVSISDIMALGVSRPQPEPSPSAQAAMTMPDRLTASQIQRIETVLHELGDAGNGVARAIMLSLVGKAEAQKRVIIANAFTQVWSVIMVVHMAVNSDERVGDIRRALREIRQGRSSPIEKIAESNENAGQRSG